MTAISQSPFWLAVAALAIGGIAVGCDRVSPVESGQPPSVSGLEVDPDSVHESDLSPSQVQDSVAQVPLSIAAVAADPDGTVERVVFSIEPASNPRGTATGTLERDQENEYRREIELGVPVFLDEVYTVRVFAVDDDSLKSNQGVGRFRFVPSS